LENKLALKEIKNNALMLLMISILVQIQKEKQLSDMAKEQVLF
jgi:hypothetical protein